VPLKMAILRTISMYWICTRIFFREAYEERYVHGTIHQAIREKSCDKDELGIINQEVVDLCGTDLTLVGGASWW
jgi:hypothetical protein